MPAADGRKILNYIMKHSQCHVDSIEVIGNEKVKITGKPGAPGDEQHYKTELKAFMKTLGLADAQIADEPNTRSFYVPKQNLMEGIDKALAHSSAQTTAAFKAQVPKAEPGGDELSDAPAMK